MLPRPRGGDWLADEIRSLRACGVDVLVSLLTGEEVGELDLAEVQPTSHVIEVTGALRADEPRPCLPREVVLAQAPAVSDDGFLVPSPQA